MISKLKYVKYPKEWGEQLYFTGRIRPLKPGDLDTLEDLRLRFAHKKGQPLSWKFDLEPLSIPGLMATMRRLWKHRYVVKFATSHNTLSDRPQYIKWYIWED